MKKNNLLLLILVIGLSIFVSSCSNDDEDNDGGKTTVTKLYVTKITLDGFEEGRVSSYTFSYDDNNRVTGWNGLLQAGSNTFNVSRKINYTTEEYPNTIADGIKSIEEYVNDKLMFTETYPQEPANNMVYENSTGSSTTITDVSSLWQYLTPTSDHSYINRNYKYDSFNEDPNPKSFSVIDSDLRRSPQSIEYEYAYTYDVTKKGIFTNCNLPVWVINMRFYNNGEDFPINQNITKTCTGIQYKRLETGESGDKLIEKENLIKIFDISYNEYGYPTTIADSHTNRKYIIEYKIVTE